MSAEENKTGCPVVHEGFSLDSKIDDGSSVDDSTDTDSDDENQSRRKEGSYIGGNGSCGNKTVPNERVRNRANNMSRR